MILISMLSEVREGFLEEGCSNWFGRAKGGDRLESIPGKGKSLWIHGKARHAPGAARSQVWLGQIVPERPGGYMEA